MPETISMRLWEHRMRRESYPDVDWDGNIVMRGMLDFLHGPQGYVWERTMPEEQALEMISLLEDMGGETMLDKARPNYILCCAYVDYGVCVVQIELRAWIGVGTLDVYPKIEPQADIDFLA
jgi:hypothetical protein